MFGDFHFLSVMMYRPYIGASVATIDGLFGIPLEIDGLTQKNVTTT